jgi:RecA-family ATPase
MSDWSADPFANDEAATGARGKPNGAANIRFKFTQFRDIKIGTAPAYVVDGMIPRLGVVVLWGRPKCGKTFWALDLEMHIALGWLYRGQRVEQGEVLHIACEGVAGVSARKEAWRLAHIKGKAPGEIEFIEACPFHLCRDTALDLIKDVDNVVADITLQFGDRPIRAITIDTLNRSLKGSESKDDDMAAYVRAATLLAETFQCVVIIIHHCGHTEARPRGHSSLLGAVDALIEINKDAGGRFALKSRKCVTGQPEPQRRADWM